MQIKDIEGYKGNDTGFAKLYAAIWERAVEDEHRHQMVRLMVDTSEKLFSGLLRYDKADCNTYTKVSRLVGLEYGAQGIRFMQELEALIGDSKEAVKKAVQAKIYREAEAWPDNRRKCPEFEKAYLQIRDNLLDAFSRRRCGRAALAFRDMLERLEWVDNDYCPICRQYKANGHANDCELAALLWGSDEYADEEDVESEEDEESEDEEG
jgi:hypothetical protein